MNPPLHIRPFEPNDQPSVVALWQACGLMVPQNDPVKDIRRKMMTQPDLFLVGLHDAALVATVMAGFEGHRGWINYLAVAPGLRRSGIGRSMMAAAEELLRRRSCPKINLQVRADNRDVIAFYERIGFKEDAVVSMGKRLEVDQPHEWVNK